MNNCKFVLQRRSSINDVTAIGGWDKDFLTTVLKPYYTDGEGVKNRPKFRDVIYERPHNKTTKVDPYSASKKKKTFFPFFAKKKFKIIFFSRSFIFMFKALKIL